MSKQGEIDYLKNIGEGALHHAVNKPFSDVNCPEYLMEFGAVMSLLPPPPARLIDLGCGTGWTSIFLAKSGYDILGVDICEDMITEAKKRQERERVRNLGFLASDYESMDFKGEFDGALFFDSLHHSVDEEKALFYVYQALKPNGVCIASEPGVGHGATQASREAVEKYGVTERDMPPLKIIKAGKKAGFRRFHVYPHMNLIAGTFFKRSTPHDGRLLSGKKILGFLAQARRVVFMARYKAQNGITVLVK